MNSSGMASRLHAPVEPAGRASARDRTPAAGVRCPAARGKQITDMIHEFVDAAEVDWSRQEGDQVDVQVAAVRSD